MAEPEDDDTTARQLTLAGIGDPSSMGDAATLVAVAATVPPTERPSQPMTAPLVKRRSRRVSGAGELEGTRYQLGKLLGQGGMGEVVLAFDEQIGREVAVKRIRAEVPSVEELSRFVREARVQGRLEHPAVVPVHDLAIDEAGRPFFVMKRLAGTTMADLLGKLKAGETEDDASTRRRLLRAFADLCLAIEFAHKKGIIHRDLKPANIMLGDFGEVYILDWGIARASGTDDQGTPRPSQADLRLDTGDTRAGTILGTPAYMAPEQLVGELATPAADIYALGCILYEIAAGAQLHRAGRSLAATAIDARPSQLRPESPPELDLICVRATATDPAARFPSARALGNAVQAFLDGDRDVAVRKELAASQLEQARNALSRGGDESDRREAMRAAGRALALDPTAVAAAELVTQLMLEPPPVVPPEVEQQLAAIDTETGKAQGKLGALSMLGYLAFVPLIVWTGARNKVFVAAFAALAVISGLHMLWMIRKNRIPAAGIYLNAAINAVLIGLISRMTGPFVIAPTLVLTTLMAYAAHPQFGRIRWLALILAAAVAVPWGLEVLGVFSSTYEFVDGTLRLHSSILEYTELPVSLAFALLLVALITTVAVLSRNLATAQRDATRRLEIQAWHLRQIVPTHRR